MPLMARAWVDSRQLVVLNDAPSSSYTPSSWSASVSSRPSAKLADWLRSSGSRRSFIPPRREEVVRSLEGRRLIVLNLAQVDALSPSFADELFGGLERLLGAEFRERIRVVTTRPEWKRLIASALAHRQAG